METKPMVLVFESALSNIVSKNDSFDSGILRVAYIGKNRNGSMIGKDAFERAIPSMYNCPIVCSYNRETDEIGGHDVEIVRTDEEIKMVNVTTPVGVIPESARYWWETVDDNGVKHEYLCVEVLLWKRQEAYDKIVRNGATSHSMEIAVNSGKLIDGVYEIYDFEFTAFCLLGGEENGILPCFESSALHLFDRDLFGESFSAQYSLMIEDFKQAFSNVQKETCTNNCTPKGGKDDLEEKMNLVTEFGFTVDDLDFSLDDIEMEQLRSKLEEMRGNASASFTLTAEQFKEELLNVLSTDVITCDWGTVPRYCYCDYDSDASEVFVYDREDWKLYGFKYSMDGDHVTIDFAKKTRKKCVYVDFEEGDSEFSFAAIADEIVAGMEKSFENERSAFNSEREELNHQIDGLRQFQTERLNEERKNAEEEIFSRFDMLDGNEAFEQLRSNCSDIELNDLEEKCYAILGRTQKFSSGSQKQDKPPRIPGGQMHHESEPYGGLFVKYKK